MQQNSNASPNDIHPLTNEDINPFPYKFVLITLGTVLAILLLVGFSWYFLGGKDQISRQPNTNNLSENSGVDTLDSGEQVQVTVVPPNTPTPTVTPAPLSETSNWKRFTSPKYNYTFQYPPSYFAAITAQTDPKILEYVVLNTTASTSASMNITTTYSSRTYTEALALNNATAEEIKVGSITGSRKIVQNSAGEITVHVILPDNKNSITFVAKDKFKDILAQILLTFKFIN